MKTKSLFLLGLTMLFSGFLFIASCTKKDNDGGGGDPGDDDPEETFDKGTISMKIDGASWTGDPEELDILILEDVLQILAGYDNTILSLYGSPFSGEADYPYAFNPIGSATYIELVSVTSYKDTSSGSVSITNYNAIEHRVSGEFDASAFVWSDPSQSIEITDGVFTNVPISFFKEQNPSVISFKIDGNVANLTGATSSTIPQDKSLVISFSTEDDNSGDLAIPYGLDPGTYDYNLLQPDLLRFWYNYMVPTSGSLTITVNDKVNHHIEGNFHCEMYGDLIMESASITDGVFSLDY